MDFAGFYLELWMIWTIAIICYVLAGSLTAKFFINNDADLKIAENYSQLTEIQKGAIVSWILGSIAFWPFMLIIIIIFLVAVPKKFR